MTRKNFYYGALVVGAAATLTLAVTLTVSISRSHRKPSPASSAPILAQATTSTATESKGGQKELIKVHGHWTIDVRNPDGTLVSHNEFENSLQPVGVATLPMILGRKSTAGSWQIALYSVGAFATTGWIFEVGRTIPAGLPGDKFFPTLQVSIPTSGDDAGKLVLNGTATARGPGQIMQVRTFLGTCASNVTADDCAGTSPPLLNYTGDPFTDFTTGGPIVTVAIDQIIQVKVVISFS